MSLEPRDEERTRELMRDARRFLAHGPLDGFLRRPWAPVDGDPFPQFVERAQGYEVVDTLGRTYVDWVGGGGAVLLGHCDPSVERAIVAELARGSSLSLTSPLEVELARDLCAMISGAERVAFGKNGSDALTAAVRVARATTGREIVLHYGMHGFHDWFVAGNPTVRGAPSGLAERIHAFPYADIGALEELFARHRGEVAAVVMEPVREILPPPGYVRGVADLARRHGAMLVFDEVVTALRLGPGGGAAYVGVEPDLACLGKSLANGLPLSALVGRARAMEVVPAIAFGMTFRGETLALAAATAVVRAVREERVSEHLAEIGEELRARYVASAARANVRTRLAGPPARMTFTFEAQGGCTPDGLAALFVEESLKRGILTNGNVLPSRAHDVIAVERSARAFDEVLDVLAVAIGVRAPDSSEPRTPPRAARAKGYIESIDRVAGRVRLTGWMLLEDGPPDVLTASGAMAAPVRASNVERVDVGAAYPGVASSARAGFVVDLPTETLGEFVLTARRGDRDVYVCRVVLASDSLERALWLGDGIAFG